MDLEPKPETSDKIVRVSFGWLLAGVPVVVLLGLLGGFIAQQLWPALPPLVVPGNGQLISTVQEVTISPNTSAANVLENAHRSVVLLGRAGLVETSAVATGVVVTNDGLIVSVENLPETELVAFDYQGRELVLERVGHDALFGLTYLRARESVLLPLDLRSDAIPVGYELLAVSRNPLTFSPRILFYQVLETTLPAELMPRGIRRMLRGATVNDIRLSGSPLVDDEGKLAGLLLNPAVGLSLPVDQLRESIERVTGGKRESDPFAELGVTFRYTFAQLAEGGARRFAIEITGVSANSPAAAAGLARGDLILSVDEQALDWQQSVLKLLTHARPFNVAVQRGERELTLSIP